MSEQAPKHGVRLPLTAYGWKELVVLSVILIAAAVVMAAFGRWPYAAIPLLLLVFVVSFFRDPERGVPEGRGLMLSPADGKVVEVAEVNEPDFIQGRAVRIGIFLSVFNVHVNRAPCAGVVRSLGYHRGRFRNAMLPAAAEQNENNAIGIECADARATRIVVRQIAGAIARRIVCDCAEGQPLSAGQRIGMIKFGSRTELYVPAGAPFAVQVDVGQRVKGGSTILGKLEWDEPDEGA